MGVDDYRHRHQGGQVHQERGGGGGWGRDLSGRREQTDHVPDIHPWVPVCLPTYQIPLWHPGNKVINYVCRHFFLSVKEVLQPCFDDVSQCEILFLAPRGVVELVFLCQTKIEDKKQKRLTNKTFSVYTLSLLFRAWFRTTGFSEFLGLLLTSQLQPQEPKGVFS